MSFSYPCTGCTRTTDRHLKWPLDRIFMCETCKIHLAARWAEAQVILGELVRK